MVGLYVFYVLGESPLGMASSGLCIDVGVMCLVPLIGGWSSSHWAVVVLCLLSFLGLVVFLGSLAGFGLLGILRDCFILLVVIE
jgi:hypothetical protein